MICNYFCNVFYYPANVIPISVATQCKAWVCCRLFAGIAGSIPAGSMDIYLLSRCGNMVLLTIQFCDVCKVYYSTTIINTILL
jgi:hypothetical protein